PSRGGSRLGLSWFGSGGRSVHADRDDGNKWGRSLSFEAPPVIQVGHSRWLRKARCETLERESVQYEATKLHTVRREEQFDLAQGDVMLLHVKQEVTTFIGREEIIPVDNRLQRRSVLGRHHSLTPMPNILWNRPIAAIRDEPARCNNAPARQFAVETNQHDAAWTQQ